MALLGMEQDVVDREVVERTVRRFREARIVLPTFAELAEPCSIPRAVREALAGVDPDAAHPLNLFRVHWWNDAARRAIDEVPGHLVLGRELTGVDAPIIVALGERFPMIQAHKVLAAYACLAPRLVTGRFDPTTQRAVWPSTGNYCRGGVAISRLMDCRGVAVLPAGMSAERFRWLERWVTEPGDILRTPGSESNVREIYEACAVLERDPANVVFNQFREFGNHLAHFLCTGRALERLFTHVAETGPRLSLETLSTQPQLTAHDMDVMIVLDVSPSMAASDLAPNRMLRAKLKLQDLIARWHGERIGLIAYSGEAGLLLPLTRDTGAFIPTLEFASGDLFEDRGSHLAAALNLALKNLGNAQRSRAVLLVTDAEASSLSGDAGNAAITAARSLKAAGVSLYVLVSATDAGATLTKNDAPVNSKPELAGYRAMTEITGRVTAVGRASSETPP
ncbi:MAG: VWA domain-containing protein, partial [Candidatus Eisenbacteria bacterium]